MANIGIFRGWVKFKRRLLLESFMFSKLTNACSFNGLLTQHLTQVSKNKCHEVLVNVVLSLCPCLRE